MKATLRFWSHKPIYGEMGTKMSKVSLGEHSVDVADLDVARTRLVTMSDKYRDADSATIEDEGGDVLLDQTALDLANARSDARATA